MMFTTKDQDHDLNPKGNCAKSSREDANTENAITPI